MSEVTHSVLNSRPFRLSIALFATLAATLALSLPAAAQGVDDVGLFAAGNAHVGTHFVDPGDLAQACQDVEANRTRPALSDVPAYRDLASANLVSGDWVDGDGLMLPGYNPNGSATSVSPGHPSLALADAVQGVYTFSNPVTSLSFGTGRLFACGDLGGEDATSAQRNEGIGASCGSSSSAGVAYARFPDNANPSDELTVNYSWVATAGGTLPITGTMRDVNSGAESNLVAVVQAQGGAGCFPNEVQNVLGQVGEDDRDGAQNFVVNGAYGAYSLP